MSGQRNWVLLEEVVHSEYEKCASVQKRVKKVGEPTGEGAAVTRLGGPKLRRRNMRLLHLWMVITVWGLLSVENEASKSRNRLCVRTVRHFRITRITRTLQYLKYWSARVEELRKKKRISNETADLVQVELRTLARGSCDPMESGERANQVVREPRRKHGRDKRQALVIASVLGGMVLDEGLRAVLGGHQDMGPQVHQYFVKVNRTLGHITANMERMATKLLELEREEAEDRLLMIINLASAVESELWNESNGELTAGSAMMRSMLRETIEDYQALDLTVKRLVGRGKRPFPVPDGAFQIATHTKLDPDCAQARRSWTSIGITPSWRCLPTLRIEKEATVIRNGYNGCFILPPATEGIHLMDGSLVFNNNGYELKKKCTTKELEKFRFRYRNGTFYVSPRSGNGTRGDTLLKSNCGAQSGFKEVLMDASAGVTLRQPCSGQIENQGVSIFVHNIPVIFDDKNVTIDGSEISDQPWMLGGNWTSKETEELVVDTKKMAMSNDLVFDAGIGFYPTVAACVAVLVTLVSAGVLLGIRFGSQFATRNDTVTHVPVMFEPSHHEVEEDELRRISLLNHGLRELNLSLSKLFRGKEEEEADASDDELGGGKDTTTV